MAGIFETWAPKYFEQGINVIPCKGKRPVIPDWAKYSTERLSEEELTQWISRYPNLNVGIVTGQASGISALDIDDEKYLEVLPKSPFVRKGKKGEVRFFKWEPWQESKSVGGIDFISTGRQVIVNGIHPDGMEYVSNGIEIDELPSFDKEAWKTIFSNSENIDTEEGGRNTEITRQISGAYHNGNLFTVPLIEHAKQLLEGEQGSWFSDESEPHKGRDPLKNALYTVADHTRRLLKKNPVPVDEIRQSQETRIEISDEIEVSVDPKVWIPEPYGWRMTELFECQSLLGRFNSQRLFLANSLAIMGTFMSNKMRYGTVWPNEMVLLVGGSAIGKSIAKKIAARVFPEIESEQKQIDSEGFSERVVSAEDYFIAGGFKSAAAVLAPFVREHANRRPPFKSRIDIIDEIASTLQRGKGGNAVHTIGIFDEIIKIFDSSSDVYVPEAKLGDTSDGITRIYNACLNLVAFIQPKIWRDEVSGSMIDQGLLSRILIFEENKKTLSGVNSDFFDIGLSGREKRLERLEESMVSWMGEMFRLDWNIDGKAKMIEATWRVKPFDLMSGTAKEVRDYLDDFDKKMTARQFRLMDSDLDFLQSFYGRAWLHVVKMAQIAAWSRCESVSRLSGLIMEDVIWAENIYMNMIEAMRSSLNRASMSNDLNAQISHDVEMLIMESRETGVTRVEIHRKFRGKEKKAIEYLINCGRIFTVKKKKPGSHKRSDFYAHINFFPSYRGLVENDDIRTLEENYENYLKYLKGT